MTLTPYREISHGDATYPVYVGPGLLAHLNEIASTVSTAPSRFVVTSGTVRRTIESRFDLAAPILMSDAEHDKTLATADHIITELIRRGARRDSVLIAIGGGVVGDTAGFAASVFLRGIDLIHVPTTLLAQVDSSIGGKVAVNHPLGKNMIGSFYPPRAVVSDTDVLSSLPLDALRSGLFEALKAGVIGDPDLFALIPEAGLVQIVQRSVDVKADIVEQDVRESDKRRLLNYGHTIGHAIEAAMKYQGITHGDAIAWGMIGANAIAVRRGVLAKADAQRINSTILSMEPTRPSHLNAEAVMEAVELDKKFTTGRRVMVLPRRIGECIVVEVTAEEIRYGVDAALQITRE